LKSRVNIENNSLKVELKFFMALILVLCVIIINYIITIYWKVYLVLEYALQLRIKKLFWNLIVPQVESLKKYKVSHTIKTI
jgi:hypothetical protein